MPFLSFFFSALSFNLLHEKCFIVARATASANLAAFNKLWLHSPRPFAASCHSSRDVLIAHCCLGFWSSRFLFSIYVFELNQVAAFPACSVFLLQRQPSFFRRKTQLPLRYFFAISLSRSLCYLFLPFTNSQLRTMLSRKEKIIGHKKCHSTKKKKSAQQFWRFFRPLSCSIFLCQGSPQTSATAAAAAVNPLPRCHCRSNANRCDTWTLGCHFKWIRCDNYVSDGWQRSRKVCYESKYVYARLGTLWGKPRCGVCRHQGCQLMLTDFSKMFLLLIDFLYLLLLLVLLIFPLLLHLLFLLLFLLIFLLLLILFLLL